MHSFLFCALRYTRGQYEDMESIDNAKTDGLLSAQVRVHGRCPDPPNE